MTVVRYDEFCSETLTWEIVHLATSAAPNDSSKTSAQSLLSWPPLLRVAVDVALALHFAAAAGWWWYSPKGFQIDRSQFWTNSVLPVATMLVAGVGLIALHYGRRTVTAAAVLCFAAAWFAAAVAARIVFPLSLAGVWLVFVLIACAGAVLFAMLVHGEPARRLTWVVSAASGMAVGLLVVWWQIPDPPSTLPWQDFVSREEAIGDPEQAESRVMIGDNADFYPGPATLEIEHANIRLSCSPLLEFDRVSPDHFWSLVLPRSCVPVRLFVQQSSTGDKRVFRYDDGSSVELPRPPNNATVALTAYSPLEDETYSHLNTFCCLEVRGHASLTLSFSPCPDTSVDALPADYPFGRPARFAYRDSAGGFHVCEATSGEKGPFRELATGKLGRDEPLTISLHDQGRRLASITLEDWSAQASTATSPSAGWGVPVNAIEFQRLGEDARDKVGIWVTLAGTSIGRGFETVGHRAGTYRNGVVIRFESPDE